MHNFSFSLRKPDSRRELPTVLVAEEGYVKVWILPACRTLSTPSWLQLMQPYAMVSRLSTGVVAFDWVPWSTLDNIHLFNGDAPVS